MLNMTKFFIAADSVEYVSIVFLHSDLQEHIFIKQPPYFVSSNSSQVCKRNKVIYSLK